MSVSNSLFNSGSTDFFVDAHVHLCDPRFVSRWDEIIKNSQHLGIQYFLQGGINPTDWELQKKLQSQFPNQIGMSFGLHPWFVAQSTEETCEQALDQLALDVPTAMALGEIGLDFRFEFVQGEARDRQIDFFRMQLELAQVAKKPCVLHLVKAFEEALKVIQWTGLPERSGMVHAFNGPREHMQSYLKEGLYISLGSAILWEKNKRLIEAVKILPLDRLLIESDAPDQPPPGVLDFHFPASIFLVAERVAEIQKTSKEKVWEHVRENFRILFK
ncbi:MAG TPA: TatD family hydrolase [Pseudobdellovibrionaceae bacterium]|nr:TatD family hydrolase [Pseudobdellovibrionaceae bacterium]